MAFAHLGVHWFSQFFNLVVPACRGFKALKQLVKVYFKHKMYDKMMKSYRCGITRKFTSKSFTVPLIVGLGSIDM